MSVEPFTEEERHEAYKYAQREAFLLARRVDHGGAVDGAERATMWATVALALRRDGVQ